MVQQAASSIILKINVSQRMDALVSFHFISLHSNPTIGDLHLIQELAKKTKKDIVDILEST